jgi:hypothetical protein
MSLPLLASFTCDLLNYAASDARVPIETLQLKLETLRNHYEEMKTANIAMDEAYKQAHEYPRSEHEQAYEQYMMLRTAKYREWKSTRDKAVQYEYLSIKPSFDSREHRPLSQQIYTKFR